MRTGLLLLCATLALGACERRGNLRGPGDYDAPPAPVVKNPWYDPYAASGEVNALWRPPVFDQRGTIVRPGSGGELGPAAGRPPGVF